MMAAKNSPLLDLPPDQPQRIAALDPRRSTLVQAPAGSGKTNLLTRRFLRLLAEVDEPGQIVAITFTRAAAAEMRHRILSELEHAAAGPGLGPPGDETSIENLAARALAHSDQRNWRLLELPSQLRISTIDSFCRDIAIQQPISAGIGSSLEIHEKPIELYRAAARSTLEKLGYPQHPELSSAIRELLLWRDNNWTELEALLIKMLGQRDRWMHGFVLGQDENPDYLRDRLEAPFRNAVRSALGALDCLLAQVPGAADEAHQLAQFAIAHGGREIHRALAELPRFPCGPYEDAASLDEARTAYLSLAGLVLNDEGRFREQIDRRLGFPKELRGQKLRLEDLIDQVSRVPGLEEALRAVDRLPPARYSSEAWQIIRAGFRLLRHAAGELKAVFAEAGAVDFIEVAQIAKHVLRGEDDLPSDAALMLAENIRHLLVDEFQDTSRRQHEFITSLIEAWPDADRRTVFVVGDPMQSIYFFRDAEAELFGRVRENGFELLDGQSFRLDSVALKANFRTDPGLVSEINEAFEKIFAIPDGSGIDFRRSTPARTPDRSKSTRLHLHLDFVPQAKIGHSQPPALKQNAAASRDRARESQTAEIVDLVRGHLDRIAAARRSGDKYRVAVLGRARAALAPVAVALREARIPFRAVELERLRDRPEILDAVALVRALFNPEDRIAWLGVLRAPWCGLSLADLHSIAGTDDSSRGTLPIPVLLKDRMELLSRAPRTAVERVLGAFASVSRTRKHLVTSSPGTFLQRIWRALGGDHCVDEVSAANLELFWRLLDKLPDGELDLVGPGLDAALEDLSALPDPAASSHCGVQLMTIHKSKGLEFEVVIVPDLQAQGGRPRVELLSWLERGRPDPENGQELTEFLIAPFQSKGDNPDKAKRWVDRMRSEREVQEMRRILYVAATRAREELHLFARPAYKDDRDGSPKLAEPSNCLLATAWPGFEDQVRARFEIWSRQGQSPPSSDSVSLLPASTGPTILHRLPDDFKSSLGAFALPGAAAQRILGLETLENYQRHEGGIRSRAFGNAVHTLLEGLSRLNDNLDWSSRRQALENWRPRIVAAVRSHGFTPATAEKIASEAMEAAFDASRDPVGQWILSPHPEAVSESGWTGIVAGSLRQVRVDRIFRAGLKPLEPGQSALWIIDYKTAHAGDVDQTAISGLRTIFAPQIQLYASVLRNLQSDHPALRGGLYYPRMSLFDWWEI